LQPQNLKGCVLIDVSCSPRQGIGIERVEALSNFLPDDWNAAQPAMMSIAPNQLALDVRIRHALRCLFFSRYKRWTTLNRSILNMRALCAPNGIQPLTQTRHVSQFDKFRRDLWLACKMRADCRIEISSSVVNTGDRLAKTPAGGRWLVTIHLTISLSLKKRDRGSSPFNWCHGQFQSPLNFLRPAPPICFRTQAVKSLPRLAKCYDTRPDPMLRSRFNALVLSPADVWLQCGMR